MLYYLLLYAKRLADIKGENNLVNHKETFMKEADSLLLKIKVPKGSNQGAYIVDASKYSPEKEFLFDKETSLIFTGISEENGKIILECDLL